MKAAICFAWLLLALSCAVRAQTTYVPKDDCAFPASKHFFHYLGDDQPVQDSELEGLPADARALHRFGSPVAVPAAPHPIEVAESGRAYADGNYAEAAELVAAVAKLEPADPTVLQCYARALYRVAATREQSRPVYLRLIELLDRYGRESPEVASIYVLYSEAYFKLATLQLDSEEWAAASYNLSRAAGSLQAQPDLAADSQASREQMSQYQTECFAHLGDVALCRYFGQRTLRFFPKNRYVRPYLAALPKPAAKPAARPRR